MSAIREQEFSSTKVNLSTWRKVLGFAVKYPRLIAGIIASMGIAAIIDVINLFLASYAIDYFIVPLSWDGLWVYALAYFLFVCLMAACVYFFVLCAGRLENHMTHDIRDSVYRKLQTLSLSFYDRMSVGYIMSRLTSDCSRLGDTIAWALVDLVWGVMFMIVSLVAMFIANWRLALVVTAVIVPIAVISIFFQKRILRLQRQVRRNNSRITGAFNEGIMGARTTKTLVRESKNLEEFAEITQDMKGSSIKAAVTAWIYMPLVMTIGTITAAVVLVLGGISVMDMSITLGELSFFIQMSTMFFWPVREIARIFSDLQSTQAAAERVVSLLGTDPDITDSPEVEAVYGGVFDERPAGLPEIKGDIRFEDVSFRYVEGEEVLHRFNLTVPAGTQVALVGETGSGKSTIVNLICRFYEPTEGTIYIDGTDYRERSLLWLHSSIGYVLQSPHLFSGTIRENIRYGRIEATDDEVRQAAESVGAHDFIMEQPQGYDTQVGEGGGMLSTGQKQLISFARAIIANPAIFVLDEATSAIDTEAEMQIQRAMEAVLSGRTSFIIAHRLSTIRGADIILYIHDGKVVESGTHAELMAKKGLYFELYMTGLRQERQSAAMRG